MWLDVDVVVVVVVFAVFCLEIFSQLLIALMTGRRAESRLLNSYI